ncbi:hypothetical protein BH24ACT26_BH24ACT26_08270 [soil metagenome]
MNEALLPLEPGRDRMMRYDTAVILERFFYVERAVVIACAGWVPGVHRLESKELLARVAWQNAMTAQALRERVFELHYPDRSLDAGRERPLATLFESALHAPSGGALLGCLGELLAPAQKDAYERYLRASDDIADGPTRRFLEVAVKEKERQIEDLAAAAAVELGLAPAPAPADRRAPPSGWERLRARLEQAGGLSLEPPPADLGAETVVAPGAPFTLPRQPARDDRYFACSFYWPDALDPGYPYGEGLRLQLRSAVSHLNEVWAVETAGAILQGLAEPLGWEFIFDAARWLYDESRHMTMGKHRLEWWGLERAAIPLGSYIYEAGRDEDIIYRLGMLAFFETKNIGKKRERVAELGGLGDRTSQRDMDFDWADEAIHAGYGRRWLRRALQARGDDPESWPEVVARCDDLVRARLERATDAERRETRACADALIARAEAIAARR